MKRILLASLSFLTALTSYHAIGQQVAYAPSLEGGFYALVGTFYAATSSDNEPYAVTSSLGTPNDFTSFYNDSNYDWGGQAAIGYVFEETANSVEVLYRGFNTDSSASTTASDGNHLAPPGWGAQYHANFASNDFSSEFNAVDVMLSQFLDIGNNVQMRFSAGLAYTEIEQKNHSIFGYHTIDSITVQRAESQFQGFGPRLSIDGRYEFGQGLGIIASGSAAYFMGQLDSHAYLSDNPTQQSSETQYYIEDNPDNHNVLNLRGNLGLDYVYYFDNDEQSSLGLEIGYLADYYDDAINQITVSYNQAFNGTFDADWVSASFSGPYVNLKGAF